MKRLFLFAPVLSALFLFTSCGDSHEKLADDQLAYIEELTQIMDDVAEGKLSSSEAAEEIKDWGDKGDKIMERKEALKDTASEEELKTLAKKFEKRSMAAMKDYMAALQKLQKSGRMTKEVQEAILNVKN